jgi:hypothetical protein
MYTCRHDILFTKCLLALKLTLSRNVFALGNDAELEQNMRITTVIAIAIYAVMAAAFARDVSRPPAGSVATRGESPFACDRLALSPEQRKHHFDELSPALRALKTGIKELPDGFEFEFAPDAKTYEMLAEWVGGERVCCPFFDIGLRSERENGVLALRLTGRPGVKQFIRADFAKWFQP